MSVSVYSGYDPTDDGSPTPAEPVDETLQVKSPDQPVSTRGDSPDGHGHDSTANLETSAQPANQQSSIDATATEESVGGTTKQNGTVQEPVSHSPVEQPSTVSTSANQVEGESSHTESTKATANNSEGGLSGLTVLPKLAVIHKANQGDQSKKHKKQWWQSNGDNSDYVSSIDSRLRVGAKPEEPVPKFGNMLNHCNSEGSDADVPKVVKPTAIKQPSDTRTNSNLLNKRGYQSATGTTQEIPTAQPFSFYKTYIHIIAAYSHLDVTVHCSLM